MTHCFILSTPCSHDGLTQLFVKNYSHDLFDVLLQKASSRDGVDLVFEVAAGNHSVWAAVQNLVSNETRYKDEELRYRQAIVFKNTDLTMYLRIILSGALLFSFLYSHQPTAC